MKFETSHFRVTLLYFSISFHKLLQDCSKAAQPQEKSPTHHRRMVQAGTKKVWELQLIITAHPGELGKQKNNKKKRIKQINQINKEKINQISYLLTNRKKLILTQVQCSYLNISVLTPHIHPLTIKKKFLLNLKKDTKLLLQ